MAPESPHILAGSFPPIVLPGRAPARSFQLLIFRIFTLPLTEKPRLTEVTSWETPRPVLAQVAGRRIAQRRVISAFVSRCAAIPRRQNAPPAVACSSSVPISDLIDESTYIRTHPSSLCSDAV